MRPVLRATARRAQRGAVLFIALIVLVAMSLPQSQEPGSTQERR